jgi:hypothetical protein
MQISDTKTPERPSLFRCIDVYSQVEKSLFESDGAMMGMERATRGLVNASGKSISMSDMFFGLNAPRSVSNSPTQFPAETEPARQSTEGSKPM